MSDEEKAEPDEQRQQQSVSAAEIRGNMRQLIDVGAQSGVGEEQMQEMLRDLADGVPYYYEDLMRYSE